MSLGPASSLSPRLVLPSSESDDRRTSVRSPLRITKPLTAPIVHRKGREEKRESREGRGVSWRTLRECGTQKKHTLWEGPPPQPVWQHGVDLFQAVNALFFGCLCICKGVWVSEWASRGRKVSEDVSKKKKKNQRCESKWTRQQTRDRL